MKLVHGAFETTLFNKKGVIIPIWCVYTRNEWNISERFHHGNLNITKRVMCLVIYDRDIKEVSILDAIKSILLNGSQKYEDNDKKYRLLVKTYDSFTKDNAIVPNFKITDEDFVSILEFEEVREMFGNKETHPQLWELCSWK